MEAGEWALSAPHNQHARLDGECVCQLQNISRCVLVSWMSGLVSWIDESKVRPEFLQRLPPRTRRGIRAPSQAHVREPLDDQAIQRLEA